MKRSKLFSLGMLATLLFTATGANAASYGDSQHIQPQKHVSSHKHVNKHYTQNIRGVNIARLEQRIKRGVKRGKLTRYEAQVAKRGVQSLKATIRVVKQDHRITNWEMNRVQQKNAKLKRKITRLLNNRTVAKRAHHSHHYVRR